MRRILTAREQVELLRPWRQAAQPPPLESINPTGSLFVDYDPVSRTGPLGPGVTTLDKALGKHPDEPITIYRGHNGEQKEIVPGDFVAAGPVGHDIAQSYAAHKDNLQEGQSPADLGSRYRSVPQVLQKTVGHGDVVCDPDDPEGGEYIYRPRMARLAKDLYHRTSPEQAAAINQSLRSEWFQ
jgi:hypothetical protein